jgi:hypothetical protein
MKYVTQIRVAILANGRYTNTMENENDLNDPDRYDAQGYLDPDNGCYDHEGNFIGRPVSHW